MISPGVRIQSSFKGQHTPTLSAAPQTKRCIKAKLDYHLHNLHPLHDGVCLPSMVLKPHNPTIQADLLESVQKRAMRIIHPELHYTEALVAAQLPTLNERRSRLFHKLVTEMQSNDPKLSHLLPSQKTHFYSLRSAMKYNLPKTQNQPLLTQNQPLQTQFYSTMPIQLPVTVPTYLYHNIQIMYLKCF